MVSWNDMLNLTARKTGPRRININKIFKSGLLLWILAGLSCAVTNKPEMLPEDELFVTRKYVGNFIGSESTDSVSFGNPSVLSVTTTLDTLYGKISVYSRKCEFKPGDRLYIRRIFESSGVFGSWIYNIENENADRVSYKISEFRNGDKVLAQRWY